jgi:hypothetical protein
MNRPASHSSYKPRPPAHLSASLSARSSASLLNVGSNLGMRLINIDAAARLVGEPGGEIRDS